MEARFDPADLARGRLAVIAAHLATSSISPALLETSPVSAQVAARAPSAIGGFLTVIDERTGKKYEIKVSDEGTVKASDFKKVYH